MKEGADGDDSIVELTTAEMEDEKHHREHAVIKRPRFR